DDIQKVRSKGVFTTHTPVPAAHDLFPVEVLTRGFPGQNGFLDLKNAASADLLRRDLQAESDYSNLHESARRGAAVNITYLPRRMSTYVNGVAKLNGEVSRRMFPGEPIEAITNGVHAATWTCPALQDVFDRYIPAWRQDNFSLRNALGLPPE